MRGRAALYVVALALGLAGCEQLPELTYETEHLRIGTQFDEPLCRGDLDHLEFVVTSLEATLDTAVNSPIDVYLWDSREWAGNPGWCSGDLSVGCYRNGSVYASTLSIEHELVHAVAASLSNSPAAFWGEGAAEALQSHRTRFGRTAPIDNLKLEYPQLSYLTAGHFSRWLFETRGAERYRALLSSTRGARAAFETTYGMSMEAAQAEYLADAPFSYGALISCNHPALESTEPLEWAETIDIDCNNIGVRGSPDGMSVFRVLTVEERGHYELWTSAEFGSISLCNDTVLVSAPEPDDPAYGDVPPVTMEFVERFSRVFSSEGQSGVLELVPGRYEVAVGFSGFEAKTAEVRVLPAPGPVPQVPHSSDGSPLKIVDSLHEFD